MRSFQILGPKAIPVKKIREELTVTLPSILPWKKPPVFRPEELEDDVERLQNVYRRQGFYHARITYEIKTEDNRVDVKLHIDEGLWVRVEQVRVEIASPPPEPDLSSLKAKVPVQVGDRFTEDNYEALKRLYLNYLVDHGFPRAQVTGRVVLDESQNTAALDLKVQPGPLCFFGPVQIQGEEKETPSRLILSKLTFKEGAPFSFKELYDSQQRLYALDLFQSVTLTPEEAKLGECGIPIIIMVKEKKKRSVKIGLGYGDEDEFRGRLLLRFRNLGGGGRMLDLDGKISRLEYRLESTFTNPLLWNSRNDFVAQTGLIRRYLPGFTDRAFFTQARLERDLPWRFRGFLGYGLEFARPFNIPLETLFLLSETETGKLYRSSMVLAGLRRDTMDNPADPHRGGFLTLNGEAAPEWLGSNMQFLRAVVDVRRYHGIGETDFIMAGRLRCGVIQPIQATANIPIFRRFFCGGYNSVRGYRLDYLGPRNTAGNPVGGEALLEGSLEMRIPLYKEFRAVTFLDFGNVFLKTSDTDVGQLKYAAGVGLRYQTIIGPIGVDLGIPLNPIDPHNDKYHVNFTIGQAF